MLLETPAPFVSAFVEAIDETLRQHSPSHGMSTMQRAWLAFCVTAMLVTNSVCWARFARASLGTGFASKVKMEAKIARFRPLST
jgi:hypothetical protein